MMICSFHDTIDPPTHKPFPFCLDKSGCQPTTIDTLLTTMRLGSESWSSGNSHIEDWPPFIRGRQHLGAQNSDAHIGTAISGLKSVPCEPCLGAGWFGWLAVCLRAQFRPKSAQKPQHCGTENGAVGAGTSLFHGLHWLTGGRRTGRGRERE